MNRSIKCALLYASTAVGLQLTSIVIAENADFWRDNDAAMQRMMVAMHVAPSGSVDRDFVAMMIPHHQGAIDMAKLELRDGHNEQLRRLAQEIIVTQQSEIGAMQLALNPLPTHLPKGIPHE